MMKNYISITRLLLIIIFFKSTTDECFSQRLYSDKELLKKGIEATYYLEKGDENALSNLIYNKEGLKYEAAMSKPNYLVFEKHFNDPLSNSQNSSHFFAIIVDKIDPKSPKINIYYSHYENGREYDLKSSFMNELKYNTVFEDFYNNQGFVLRKGGNRGSIELIDFLCAIIPYVEFNNVIKCQFFIIKDMGNYSLEDILEGL